MSPPVARSARCFGQGRGRPFIRRLCRPCQMPSTSVGDRGASERSRQRCVGAAPVGKWRAIYGGRANNRVAEYDVRFRNAEESGRLGVAERSCIDAELAACSDERLERCVLIQRREQQGASRRRGKSNDAVQERLFRARASVSRTSAPSRPTLCSGERVSGSSSGSAGCRRRPGGRGRQRCRRKAWILAVSSRLRIDASSSRPRVDSAAPPRSERLTVGSGQESGLCRRAAANYKCERFRSRFVQPMNVVDCDEDGRLLSRSARGRRRRSRRQSIPQRSRLSEIKRHGEGLALARRQSSEPVEESPAKLLERGEGKLGNRC